MIPELTASVGVPRIAAIEHPFGLTLGLPGDAARQLEVLRGALHALEEIAQPGGVIHLPFEWNPKDKLNVFPPEVPPIARYLRLHPWHFGRFLRREPPEAS
jgi:D-proline reductase (dithiol) PrdB